MSKELPFNRMMILRTILFALAWVNQLLVSNGYSALPFDDAQLEIMVSSVITFVVSVWAWWKNNDVTRKARKEAENKK